MFRDGSLLRPLAPYLELWALVGDGSPSALAAAPVTPALLEANGAQETSIIVHRGDEPQGGASHP